MLNISFSLQFCLSSRWAKKLKFGIYTAAMVSTLHLYIASTSKLVKKILTIYVGTSKSQVHRRLVKHFGKSLTFQQRCNAGESERYILHSCNIPNWSAFLIFQICASDSPCIRPKLSNLHTRLVICKTMKNNKQCREKILFLV